MPVPSTREKNKVDHSAKFKSEVSMQEIGNMETMDNYVDSVLITDDDINYQEIGTRTIRDFRRVSPHVNKMDDLVRQDN